MTWTRPPLAGVAPRLFHYARSRTVLLTVAMCGAEWPTGLSEAKAKTGPRERCPGCEALRSALHSTTASRTRALTRSALRRAAAGRSIDVTERRGTR